MVCGTANAIVAEADHATINTLRAELNNFIRGTHNQRLIPFSKNEHTLLFGAVLKGTRGPAIVVVFLR